MAIEMKTLTIGSTTYDVVDSDAVHSCAQTLTEAQKAQARANIGAICAEDVPEQLAYKNLPCGEASGAYINVKDAYPARLGSASKDNIAFAIAGKCGQESATLSGDLTIEVSGKNLYPSTNAAESSNVLGWQGDTIEKDGEWLKLTSRRTIPAFSFQEKCTFRKGFTYYVSFDTKVSSDCTFNYAYIMNTGSGNVSLSKYFTLLDAAATSAEKRLSFKFMIHDADAYTGNLMLGATGCAAGDVLWIKNLQVERDAVTEWHPYVGTSTQIDLDGEVLASLPDGTRDEVRVYADGKTEIVKRVNESISSALETPEVVALGTTEVPSLPDSIANAWVEGDGKAEFVSFKYQKDIDIVLAQLAAAIV